jgi:hypothetical protein
MISRFESGLACSRLYASTVSVYNNASLKWCLSSWYSNIGSKHLFD